MKSSRKQFCDELQMIESSSMVESSSSAVARSNRSRKAARVDDKVLFERLWKGTFRAIVAASLQAREKSCLPLASTSRRSTLRSVIRFVYIIVNFSPTYKQTKRTVLNSKN